LIRQEHYKQLGWPSSTAQSRPSLRALGDGKTWTAVITSRNFFDDWAVFAELQRRRFPVVRTSTWMA